MLRNAGVDVIDIIDETARLLSGMTFSTERGGVAYGERVQVIVDPRWDAQRSRFRVALRCCTVGFDGAPWGGIPVVIERLDLEEAQAAQIVTTGPAAAPGAGGGPGGAGSVRPGATPARAVQTLAYAYQYPAPARAGTSMAPQPGFVAMLNARGHAKFENLPVGAYRLFASALWDEAALQERSAPAPAARGEGLRASLIRADDGAVRVAAETNDKALAGAKVRCVLVDPSSRVCARGEFTLAAGGAGCWRGCWTEAAAPAEADRLICQAFI